MRKVLYKQCKVILPIGGNILRLIHPLVVGNNYYVGCLVLVLVLYLVLSRIQF